MSDSFSEGSFSSAIDDFRAARNQAALKEIWARITGHDIRLLSYEDVRQKLRAQTGSEVGLSEIPLDSIVGSVGRYTDFTRDFLPLVDANRDRWARVRLATTQLTGLPPIEVYRIGEAYFVKDGNHRVSVARKLGAKSIQAYVTDIRTRVPLTPDVSPDDLIIKAEYARFLEETQLDVLRPQADLTVTVPGKYQVLKEHIDVHRYYMGLDFQRDISYEEAAAHWYDHVYLPVVEIIRQQGILHSFPDRTETDLYLWIVEHRAVLEDELGWKVHPEAAARDLVEQHGPKDEGVVSRIGGKLLEALTIETFEPGPRAGRWREQRQARQRDDRLFSEILVPVSGEPEGWNALEQALVIAAREGSILHGLHVIQEDADRAKPDVMGIQAYFQERCRQAGVAGALALAIGDVSNRISDRARWNDLVVTNLAYPPGKRPLARLSSGFRDLVQRCPRPVLAAPGMFTALDRALLAYDGSPKAREALFVATYLAGRWHIPLFVVTVPTDGTTTASQDEARQYLEDHQVEAAYVIGQPPVGEAILQAVQEHGCNFLIIGGYGNAPVLEMVLGSTVDQVLRESRQPVLICR